MKRILVAVLFHFALVVFVAGVALFLFTARFAGMAAIAERLRAFTRGENP